MEFGFNQLPSVTATTQVHNDYPGLHQLLKLTRKKAHETYVVVRM